jgi:Zn finger protein HypA/HybF involved in hydrogenase expression
VTNTTPEARKPFYGRCNKCDHTWVIMYYPLALTAAVKLLRAACPMCGGRKHVVIPKQEDGKLLEPEKAGT